MGFPITERYSLDWQKLGFQGKDPATDFRSMGMLALDDLCHYVKIHKKQCFESVRIFDSYAIVGISITAYCLRLLRTRHLSAFFYMTEVNVDSYHEFYCFCFVKFGEFWLSKGDKASIHTFSQYFKDFQIDFETNMILSEPESFYQDFKQTLA